MEVWLNLIFILENIIQWLIVFSGIKLWRKFDWAGCRLFQAHSGRTQTSSYPKMHSETIILIKMSLYRHWFSTVTYDCRKSLDDVFVIDDDFRTCDKYNLKSHSKNSSKRNLSTDTQINILLHWVQFETFLQFISELYPLISNVFILTLDLIGYSAERREFWQNMTNQLRNSSLKMMSNGMKNIKVASLSWKNR